MQQSLPTESETLIIDAALRIRILIESFTNTNRKSCIYGSMQVK